MSKAQKRLLAYLDRLEPSVRKDVERALARLQAKVTLAELVAAIEQVDLFVVQRLTAGLPKDLQRATEALARAAQAGSRVAAPMVAQGSLGLTNLEAVRVAEKRAAVLVTRVTHETRKAIRTIIAASISDGISPRESAQLIKPLIGLTDRQAKAVLNQRKADARKGLTQAQIDARSAKYSAKLLKQRAMMIARTELIAAATEGQIALWKKAQADGLLPPWTRKQWMVTPDDRLCPRCAALDGVSVLLHEPFTEGTNAVSGPPLHTQCRCTLVIANQKSARRAA